MGEEGGADEDVCEGLMGEDVCVLNVCVRTCAWGLCKENDAPASACRRRRRRMGEGLA